MSTRYEARRLKNRIKTETSVVDKIRRIELKEGKTEEEAILGMYDIIRYTQQSSHDKICENTNKTIEILKGKGYDVVEVDNKYLDSGSDYKGIHIKVVAPNGQKFEIQFHSPESLKVKDVIHPLYKEYSSLKTSPEKRARAMQRYSSSLPNPKGVETVQNFKKE